MILDLKVHLINDGKIGSVFLPNEIFKDLISCKKLFQGGTSHIAFAYSYIYFSYWLYRNCKYDVNTKFTQSIIKEVLGYSSTNKTLNYIIKKGGITDELGYTETTTDYPTFWEIEEDGFIMFHTINEFKNDNKEFKSIIRNRNFKVKFPVKAFHRTLESLSEKELDGTFYDVTYSHQVPFEVFIYCMEQADIGVIGFYIYSYLKSLNDRFSEGACVSLPRFNKELGIRTSSLDTYLESLKIHNMIVCHEQPYVFGIPDHLRKPNTYEVNKVHVFEKGSSPGKKRRVLHISTDKILRSELYAEESVKTTGVRKGLEVSESELPF